MQYEQHERVPERVVVCIVGLLALPPREAESLDVEDGEDEEKDNPEGENVEDRRETRAETWRKRVMARF